MEHLEKRRLFNVTDITMAPGRTAVSSRDTSSKRLKTPKAAGVSKHQVRTSTLTVQCVRVLGDEPRGGKQVVELKTQDTAADATGTYIAEVAN